MAQEGVKTSPVNIEERKNADIRTGDTVRVHTKVVEKGKTRTQPFEGLVIARKHGTEPGATFTVRRTSGDYGVERIFPLYSPNIEKIEILRRSKVRQANVYHVRRKVARQIRREMRRMTMMGNTLADESVDENADAEAEEGQEAVADDTTEQAADESADAGDEVTEASAEDEGADKHTEHGQTDNEGAEGEDENQAGAQAGETSDTEETKNQ